MELKKLIYTVQDGIAIITMNYLKNLNAIDEPMADELLYVVDAAEKDPAVKVVVLKGSPKAFSAGGDIGYFYQLIQAGGEVNMDGLISKVGAVADGMKRMSKIVITSVCGAAAGAGVSLALGGDFMICADNAKFILAFVNLGLVPDTGATYLLSKSIGTARTMELAATGRPMSAEEAKALGLAYKVTTVEELDEVTLTFARKLAAGPLISYKNIKKQLYDANYADVYKRQPQTSTVPSSCTAREWAWPPAARVLARSVPAARTGSRVSSSNSARTRGSLRLPFISHSSFLCKLGECAPSFVSIPWARPGLNAFSVEPVKLNKKPGPDSAPMQKIFLAFSGWEGV